MKIQIHNGIQFLIDSSDKLQWEKEIINPFRSLEEKIPNYISGLQVVDPIKFNERFRDKVIQINQAKVKERVQEALEKSYKAFQHGAITQIPETVHVGLFLSDESSEIHNVLNNGFTGFGGIPGFIILILSPTDFVLKRIEALVSHEFHHNVRFMIDPWPQNYWNDLTVGKYLLDEGMAEAFAAMLYGEDSLGNWTTGLTEEQLKDAVEIIQPKIEEKGFLNAQSYLFGDEMADTYQYKKRGLPHAAGYAVGFRWVQEYMKKTGLSIVDVTKVKASDILMELNA